MLCNHDVMLCNHDVMVLFHVSPQVELTPNNIETILNTLVYDGKAESSVVVVGRGEEGGCEGVRTVYRLLRPLVSDAGLSRVPCGVCPVRGCDDV